MISAANGPTEIAESILELTRKLVQVSSRAGIDSVEPILECASAWLNAHAIPAQAIRAGGTTLALLVRIEGVGPTYLLNAALDTASFGDPRAWSCDPVAGTVHQGWLYGRGSADNKVGAAIFMHLARALSRLGSARRPNVLFVFDTDEHSGVFAGIRAVLESVQASIAGGAIGYPGFDRLLLGGRGFLRARAHVHGVAAHSGAGKPRGINAISRAAAYVTLLEQTQPNPGASDDFPLLPRITVTEVAGGGDFSLVPDRCSVSVDVRLTPRFDAAMAESLLRELLRQLDELEPSVRASELEVLASLPAYRISEEAPMVRALIDAARDVLGYELPIGIAGPSNIGNWLALQGVGVACGFGVKYRNLHAVDECIEIASIEPTYLVYARALEILTRQS